MTCEFCGVVLREGDFDSVPACADCVFKRCPGRGPATGNNKVGVINETANPCTKCGRSMTESPRRYLHQRGRHLAECKKCEQKRDAVWHAKKEQA